MDHRVGTADGLGYVGWAAHVASRYVHFGREVRCRAVKQDAHLVALAGEPGYQRVPERPSRTRHEHNRHLDHLPFRETLRYCIVSETGRARGAR